MREDRHEERVERISDITVGDSWGSELPVEERNQGISLILIQTQKGESIVKMADLHINDVDSNNAVMNNGQLRAPSDKPQEREAFMRMFHKGKKYDRIVFKIAPKVFIRQDIKCILYRMLKKSGGIMYTILVRK